MKKNVCMSLLILFSILLTTAISGCYPVQFNTGREMQSALLEKYPDLSLYPESNTDGWREIQTELKEQIRQTDHADLLLHTLYCTDIFLLKCSIRHSGTVLFSMEDFQQDFLAAAAQHPSFHRNSDTVSRNILEASARLLQTMASRPSALLPGTDKIQTNVLGEINSAVTISWYKQFQDALKGFAAAAQDPLLDTYTQKSVLLLELSKAVQRSNSNDLKALQKIEKDFQPLLKDLNELRQNHPAAPSHWHCHFKVLHFASDVLYQRVRNALLTEYEKNVQEAEKNYDYLKQLDTINHLPEGSFKLAELEIVSWKLTIWELKYG